MEFGMKEFGLNHVFRIPAKPEPDLQSPELIRINDIRREDDRVTTPAILEHHYC